MGARTLLVQEFYTMLTEIDTEDDEWEVIIRRVQVRISPNILAHYLGMTRQLGAYSTVEPSIVLPADEVFHTV